MLCNSASVECEVSATPRRLNRRHVHVQVALCGPPVGAWCVSAVLKCWVVDRCHVLMFRSDSIGHAPGKASRPTGGRTAEKDPVLPLEGRTEGGE